MNKQRLVSRILIVPAAARNTLNWDNSLANVRQFGSFVSNRAYDPHFSGTVKAKAVCKVPLMIPATCKHAVMRSWLGP